MCIQFKTNVISDCAELEVREETEMRNVVLNGKKMVERTTKVYEGDVLVGTRVTHEPIIGDYLNFF